MPYRLESDGSDKTMRCAVCEGKFGLVRHYSWRTPLCSWKCVDRFKARRQTGTRLSKPWFVWRNYSRTLNNPRAIEDRPAEM